MRQNLYGETKGQRYVSTLKEIWRHEPIAVTTIAVKAVG